MRLIHLICFTLIIIGLTGFNQTHAQNESDDGHKQPYPLERKDLIIPSDIWDRACTNVGYEGKPLGYTIEEMAHYTGSKHVLPSIEGLFRDVKNVPGFSGRMGDFLLKDPTDVAFASYLAYSLLDSRAGRGIEVPIEDDWGVDWIDKGASVDEALDAIFELGVKRGLYNSFEIQRSAEYDKVPDSIKRLTARVLIASIETTPWLQEAYNTEFLTSYFDLSDISQITHDDLYEFVSAPWQDTEYPTPRESFESLDKIDLGYLAFSTQLFLKLVQAAIKEYLDSGGTQFGDFEICEFDTVIGRVGIFGHESDTIKGNYSLIIDTGGNDTYLGRTAVPRSFKHPIGIVIDLAGDDKYDSGDESAALACGNHGIGVIFDLDGDDEYTCADSGIACAWYGSGLVIDYSGDDSYKVNGGWGEGAAHAGLGMLVDINGDDNYYCMRQSQAFGSTLGVGILLDVEGNDIYLADPEGAISQPFGGNTVSFAQGTGFGRRADFGDGHSLGGGYGILIEGDGNDIYEGGVYCQGAGYWWAVGVCEDRSGDDWYKNVWYSLGSAPHFAIGCCVDLEGDDKYNIDNEEKLRCQTQACARDGSIAVFYDGSGNDKYYHTNRCAGSGDLNSIAVFWDRCGDDDYVCNRDASYILDLTYGDAPYYEPFGNFHDDLLSVGIFFDTGGNDNHAEMIPDELPDGFEHVQIRNNHSWNHKSGPRFYGFGIDIEWY